MFFEDREKPLKNEHFRRLVCYSVEMAELEKLPKFSYI
jgi:hypothetical protein